MLPIPKRAALAVFACALLTTFVVAPPSVADQAADSADTVINRLTEQGYQVQINWVGGASSKSLTECRVLGIHNPDRSSPPADKSNTTVYVDVSCPNEPDDSGITFGPSGGFVG